MPGLIFVFQINVNWRFEIMWFNNQKSNALHLLTSISESYPLAFNWVTNRLYWQ